MNNNEPLNEDEILVDEQSLSVNEPNVDDVVINEPRQKSNREIVDETIDGMGSEILQRTGVPKPLADKAVKNGGGFFMPGKTPGFIKNKARNTLAKNLPINGNDASRLQQALSKKNEPLANNQQGQNNQQNQQEGQTQKSEGLIDKGAKTAITQVGSTAITAASGGVIPKPIADMLASKLSGPALKRLKFQILMFMVPILLLLIVIIPVIIAGSQSGSSSSSSDNTISAGGSCSYKVGSNDVSNVKVRLLQCNDGTRGNPIPGEELVDFEKYILGVVYAEVGGGAGNGAKAQAIAARSYALTRVIPQYGEKGPEKQDDGTWIVSLRNCTETQVYCDPDVGCTVKNGSKAETSKTVYSGKISGHDQYKGPMAADDPTREAIASTAGQVGINSGGKVAYTDYTQTQQDLFDKYAREGKDYFEIIKKIYSNVVSITSNCTTLSTGASGDFTNWKQCDEKWGKMLLGQSKTTTICKAGCAATSVAIQIAKSGAKTTFSNLNPGTFVEEYNKVGGFDGALIYFSNVHKVAPTFRHIDTNVIKGSKADKAKKLSEYLKNGEYVVIGVYKSSSAQDIGHWVALDRVDGNTVYINDPGQSNGNKLFDLYKYTISRPIKVHRYKKN